MYRFHVTTVMHFPMCFILIFLAISVLQLHVVSITFKDTVLKHVMAAVSWCISCLIVNQNSAYF